VAFWKYIGAAAQTFPEHGITANPGEVFSFGSEGPPPAPQVNSESAPLPLASALWAADNGPATANAVSDEIPNLYSPLTSSGGPGPKRAVTASLTPPTGASNGDLWRSTRPPIPVIFDTDWNTDPDDTFGLRVLLTCERQGLVEIKAITCNVSNPLSPGGIDALLTYHVRTGIPIGKSHTTHQPGDTLTWHANLFNNNPHQIGLEPVQEDAVSLMRRTLAASTIPVDIHAQGHCNNLQDLLQSAPDAYSALTGLQLVKAKVRELKLAAGTWPTGSEHNFNYTTLAKTSGNYVMANWPTPIQLFGGEVGSPVTSGQSLRVSTAGLNDPLTVVFNDFGSIGGRQSWGPMASRVWSIDNAVAAGYTEVVGTGSVNASTGANTWVTDPKGKHRYLVLNRTDNSITRELEVLYDPATATDPATAKMHVFRDGVWQAPTATEKIGVQPTPRLAVTGVTDAANLWARFLADDVAAFGDGVAVSHWPDQVGNAPMLQTTAGARPTYRAAIGGKTAVDSTAGSRFMVSSAVQIPRDVTMYARCRWAVVPSGAFQIVVGAESTALGGSGGTHVFNFGCTTTATVQAASFQDGTSKAAVTSTAVQANTWHTLTFRQSMTQGQVEALLDGAGSGVFTVARPTTAKTPISLFAQKNDGALYMVGYVHEVRIYDGRHSDAQVAAVVAEMV
jgi:hypothetical protein